MYITLIEPMDGSALRKRRMRCADGQVITLPEDPLTRGRASVWPVPYAGGLAGMLDAASEQAIVLGVPKGGGAGPWWIVTKDAFADASRGRSDVIARTLDWFGWPAGPGWLLIDLDVPIDRPLEMLQYLWPELAEASLVLRPSSSYATGPGKAGMHVFVLISDASKSRMILEELSRRAAHIGMPDAIDVVVGSPERLIYVAPPILLAGASRGSVPATWWREGCAVGMANIVQTEREAIRLPREALGELADPATWPGDLISAVEGYLLSVVHGLCGDIGSERKGKRSLRLFSSGARLGNYAWTKSRALTGAGDLLLEAAAVCGYFTDYRPEVAQGHLARGWAEGCTKPEAGLPVLLRWQRRDEIFAAGAAMMQVMKRRG